jgi:hypothetical protein
LEKVKGLISARPVVAPPALPAVIETVCETPALKWKCLQCGGPRSKS